MIPNCTEEHCLPSLLVVTNNFNNTVANLDKLLKQVTKLFNDLFTGCTKTKLKRDLDGLEMSLDGALVLQKERGMKQEDFTGGFIIEEMKIQINSKHQK